MSLAFLILAGRVNKRMPGALILVVAGIAASWALGLAEHGVSITGTVPSGLPELEVPDLSRHDVPPSSSRPCGLPVAFSDSILISRSFAARHHEVVDANQELLAFGVAQVAAGVTQGLPIGTSGSRTAVNDDMGATSQVSGLAAAGAIAAILLFLTGPIQYLPSAVLGAIIIYAGAKLIDPAQWQALSRSSRVEVVIAAVTVACVVMVGVLQAIVVAVALSVAESFSGGPPPDAVLGWPPPRTGTSTPPSTRMRASPRRSRHRIQDRLFFANAHFFKRRIWAAVDGAPKTVRHVVPTRRSSAPSTPAPRRHCARSSTGWKIATSSSTSPAPPWSCGSVSTRSAWSTPSGPTTFTAPSPPPSRPAVRPPTVRRRNKSRPRRSRASAHLRHIGTPLMSRGGLEDLGVSVFRLVRGAGSVVGAGPGSG